MLGTGFSDDITLKVTGDKPDNNKDLLLQIYTGDRARDPQKLEKFSINPVFAVFFSQAVNTFNQLAGGQVNYLQKSFSDGWLKAKVEPIKVDYNGKKIDAYRISMTPFVGDKYEVEDAGLGRRQVRRRSSATGAGRDRRSARHLSQPLSAGAAEALGAHTLAGVTGLENPNDEAIVHDCLARRRRPADGRRRPRGRAARQRLSDERTRRLRVRLHADERPEAVALDKCSCSIDAIAALLPYDEYEQAETIMSVRQKGGESVAMFNSFAPLLEKVKNLKRAQVEAELRCF